MRPAGLLAVGVVNTPSARRWRASHGVISSDAARWPRRSLGACARRPHGKISAHSSQPTGRIGKLRSAPDNAVSIWLIESGKAQGRQGLAPGGPAFVPEALKMVPQMYSCDSTAPRRPDSDSLNFS